MTRILVSAVVILVTVRSIAAQRPIDPPPQRPGPQTSSTGKPSQYAIAVKGRISDRRLTVSASDAAKLPFDGLRATEFTLNGSRDMLRHLRDHNRHCDEVSGV